MKGEDINLIGNIGGLDKDTKNMLRDLNYEDDKDRAANKPQKESEFFKAQKAEIARQEANRTDKHLLPKGDEFTLDD